MDLILDLIAVGAVGTFFLFIAAVLIMAIINIISCWIEMDRASRKEEAATLGIALGIAALVVGVSFFVGWRMDSDLFS